RGRGTSANPVPLEACLARLGGWRFCTGAGSGWGSCGDRTVGESVNYRAVFHVFAVGDATHLPRGYRVCGDLDRDGAADDVGVSETLDAVGFRQGIGCESVISFLT